MITTIAISLIIALLLGGVVLFFLIKKQKADVSELQKSIESSVKTEALNDLRKSFETEVKAIHKKIEDSTPKIENGKENNGNCLVIDKDIDLKGKEYKFEKNQNVIFRGGVFRNGTLIGDDTLLETGNFHCFQKVDFKGTWRTDGFNYFNFGAVSNSSPEDGAMNDATEAIQEAINAAANAGFVLDNPGGSFYVSREIYIPQAVEIRNRGGFPPDYEEAMVRKFNFHKHIYGNRQTVIYTDKNIHVLNIQSPRVHIFGGLVDTSQAEFHNKAAFRYDLSYPIWGAKLKGIAVNGNPETLPVKGNGTTGILFDCENASNPTDKTFIWSWLHAGEFTGIMRNVGIGIGRNFSPSADFKTTINSIKVDIEMDNYKQSHVLPKVEIALIEGVMQERNNLTEDEKDLAAIVAGGKATEINPWVWDIDVNHKKVKDGLYRRSKAIEISEAGAHLGARSKLHLRYGHIRNTHLLE